LKRDPLDVLFSEFVRKRALKRAGGCERCGAQKFDIQKDDGSSFPAWSQLDCAHLISRWHKSTRWDEDAAIGLCGGCHMWIDHEEEEKIELLKSKIGEEGFNLLQARKRIPARYLDRNAIEIYLRARILEVNNEFGGE